MQHPKNKHTKAIFQTGLTALAALPWIAASLPAHAQGILSNTGDSFYDSGTGSIAQFLIQTSGLYQITAVGGDGGFFNDEGYGPNLAGGQGLEVGGEIFLSQGTVLDVVAGEAGQNGTLNAGTGQNFSYAGGGGGGSFIYTVDNNQPGTLLLVAGGGGGAGSFVAASTDAADAAQGKAQNGGGNVNAGGAGGGAAGTDGNGGQGGTFTYGAFGYDGGGGTGWLSSGGDGALQGVGGSGYGGDDGAAQTPFAGGSSGAAFGGFGGGGGSGVNGGGGGGGYNGGGGGSGAGSFTTNGGGGNGSDYVGSDAGAQFTHLSYGENAFADSNGSVTIGLVPDGSPSPAPEPSQMALFGFLALGLGGLMWRARRK